jgi:hypothetical protein
MCLSKMEVEMSKVLKIILFNLLFSNLVFAAGIQSSLEVGGNVYIKKNLYLKSDRTTPETAIVQVTKGDNKPAIRWTPLGWQYTDDGITWNNFGSGGGGGGATTFLQLTDTPSSYSGQAGKVVKVKTDETGLEFGTSSGGSFDYKIAYSKNASGNLASGGTALSDRILIDTHIIQNGITHCYPMLQIQDSTYSETITLLKIAGLSIDDYTKALLHMNGENGSKTFIDEIGHTVTAYGDAAISTAQSKFGGASGHFDGNGDYLVISASSDLEFEGGDFTVDFWAYISGTGLQWFYSGASDYTFFITYNSAGTGKLGIYASSDGYSWFISADPGGNGIGATTVPLNQWNHIAVTRSGNTWRIFLNGVKDLEITASGSIVNKNENKIIGRHPNGSYCFNGYIDEFRISKGIARWTSDFTPPTQEYGEILTPITILVNGQDNSFTADTTGKYRIKIEGDSNLDYRGGVVYFK